MAVREYIGARYVPIFGREGETSTTWDNSAPYEPLTIVTYQGNSYTSRQYVPTGIDIDNGDYWVQTGDYDAQIEQYRNEVLQFDNRITDNADKISIISGLYNVIDYGADPTGVEYCESAIIAAATAASGKGYIYFPCGTYNIGTPIDLSDSDPFGLIGDGAVLTSDRAIDYLITTGQNLVDVEHKQHFHDVKGLSFICKGNVKTALKVRHHAHVSNCNFSNFTEYGIYPYNPADGQGMRVSNCTFYINPTVTDRAIGITCTTDCLIENSRLFGCKVGIDAGGTNLYDSLYFWNLYAPYETIGIRTASHSGNSTHNNIHFDTINIPCENSSGHFVGCLFYYNGGDIQPTALNFMVIKDTAQGLRTPMAWFDNCTIRTLENFFEAGGTLQPFSNPWRRIYLSNCNISNITPEIGQQLYSIDAEQMDWLHEVTGASTEGTWYRICRAWFNQYGVYTSEFFASFNIAMETSGRTANVVFQWHNEILEAKDVWDSSGLSLTRNAQFGVIKNTNDGYVDFFIKPRTGYDSLQNLQVKALNQSIVGGAMYMLPGATTYVDSDMTKMTE